MTDFNEADVAVARRRAELLRSAVFEALRPVRFTDYQRSIETFRRDSGDGRSSELVDGALRESLSELDELLQRTGLVNLPRNPGPDLLLTVGRETVRHEPRPQGLTERLVRWTVRNSF